MQEKDSNLCLWIGQPLVSLESLFGTTRQSLVMPSSDPRDIIVYRIHKLMIDSYSPENIFLTVPATSVSNATAPVSAAVLRSHEQLKEQTRKVHAQNIMF